MTSILKRPGRMMDMTIDKILQDLNDPDEDKRKRAILLLGQSVDVRAVPALMHVCKNDENLELRFYARKVLLKYREAIVSERGRRGVQVEDSENKPPSATSISDSEVEGLCADLDSPDPTMRIKAIMALVQLRSPRILQRLRILDGREGNPRVRAALMLALGLVGGEDEVDVLKGALKEDDARIRANALEALKIIGGVSATGDIAGLLRDPDKSVKDLALETLRKFPRSQLVEHLRLMMASSIAAVRDIGAYALLRLECPETLPIIIGSLSDDEISIRLKARNALVALARNGSQEAFDALNRHAGERNAPEAFMTMSVIEKRPQLDGLADPRPRERLESIRTIVEGNCVERIPDLLQALLREKDKYVRASLVLALGRLRAREAIPTIKIFLEDEDPRIRANAAESLGLIGSNDVFPALIPLLEDGNNRVRANAAVGLGKCPYIQLELPLRHMARSSQVLMRRSCIHAIVELRRPELVPMLTELANDRESVVRDRAREGLRLLAGEGIGEASSALEQLNLT